MNSPFLKPQTRRRSLPLRRSNKERVYKIWKTPLISTTPTADMPTTNNTCLITCRQNQRLSIQTRTPALRPAARTPSTTRRSDPAPTTSTKPQNPEPRHPPPYQNPDTDPDPDLSAPGHLSEHPSDP
ncbi:hypothetical protein AOQ84DRAFT_145980 [Glonium stellatum]|uniref:Uncharacterized protein n=1 Tax=Glonium stellatum TaxID=574774 RepID=A0A8E2ESF5_9PEZI|nr:hypothetical protein AOQ84DRAFT_145980 [Glonium stellatum]